MDFNSYVILSAAKTGGSLKRSTRFRGYKLGDGPWPVKFCRIVIARPAKQAVAISDLRTIEIASLRSQ